MWVPPKVHKDMAGERQEYMAALPEALEVRDHLDYWDKLLKDIDPDLTLVKARADSDVPGLVPGYYHVVRRNPTGAPSLMTVEAPDGSFAEPGSWMLDKLRQDDMWNERAMSMRQKRELREKESKEREKEREREDRVDEFDLRWKAYNSPSINFGHKGWTARKANR